MCWSRKKTNPVLTCGHWCDMWRVCLEEDWIGEWVKCVRLSNVSPSLFSVSVVVCGERFCCPSPNTSTHTPCLYGKGSPYQCCCRYQACEEMSGKVKPTLTLNKVVFLEISPLVSRLFLVLPPPALFTMFCFFCSLGSPKLHAEMFFQKLYDLQ